MPITMQDIAWKAGVSQAAVSLALSGSPQLPPATRTAIRKLADQMGYLPNPHARAMALSRRRHRAVSQQGTLGLLAPSDYSTQNSPFGMSLRHAEKLGYRLDLIPFHVQEMSRRRLTKILKSRGIAGLLVLPDFTDTPILKRLCLDWSLFPAVVLGNPLLWPPLHRVSDNHFCSAKRLVRKLGALGYRRIGLCANGTISRLHADGGWEGGYFVETRRLGSPPRLLFHQPNRFDIQTIRDWIRQEQLDAVIAGDNIAASTIVSQCGFKVPSELGVASLIANVGRNEGISGIDPRHDRIWTTAVDFLIHLIHTNQRGIPEFPQRILLEGAWVPGKTVRRMNRGK